MTRRLLLIRHAKSSWDDAGLPDHERPLSARGRRSAALLGAYLRAEGLLPDVVLCSSSRRTRETLERLAIDEAEPRVEDELYGADHRELLERLRRLQDAGAVALIGHNPGIHDFAVDLAGPDLGDGAVRLREKFPTGALARYEVDGAWADLEPGRARLVAFVVPRDLS